MRSPDPIHTTAIIQTHKVNLASVFPVLFDHQGMAPFGSIGAINHSHLQQLIQVFLQGDASLCGHVAIRQPMGGLNGPAPKAFGIDVNL